VELKLAHIRLELANVILVDSRSAGHTFV
jgi:hypothetical protein